MGGRMSRTLASPRHEALRALLVESRKAAGLTQADIASKLKRYQSFISTVESGQRRIDVIEFLDLSEVIGFDPCQALKRLKRTKRR
jgi:transcriptional regulator with XRE-family HTH domain